MHAFLPFTIVPMCTAFTLSLALANPAMLPSHPGHPMSDLRDPVNNMPLANDPRKEIWTGTEALNKAAASHDESSTQDVSPSEESLTHQGAGILPQTKGYPDYIIDPLVKEATIPNQ
ncbi:MAG: hypothetical protein NPIRA04_00980 [Nitrospirales bacterium]|nr:MAG: hypothetical protein NPIRA04_00980 [Nitrospirales bacterium]